ncbi:MAG TPA: hypothetical protein VMR14_13435 [Streptosporangiaceae bacterium]|nr:hypothetical protein [Streptosporangiaceae bacterium]
MRLYLVAYLYALASIKPHRLKLENGWTSANKRYGTGNPGYAVSGGVVYLSGSVIGGTVGDNITTLPKAVTPTHFIYRLIYDFEGNAGFIVITPTGELQVFGSQAAGFASLAGISYPVPGTKWHDFTLTNGWQSGTPSTTPAPGLRGHQRRRLPGRRAVSPKYRRQWRVDRLDRCRQARQPGARRGRQLRQVRRHDRHELPRRG